MPINKQILMDDYPKYLVINPLHVKLYNSGINRMNSVSNKHNQGIKKILAAIETLNECDRILRRAHILLGKKPLQIFK